MSRRSFLVLHGLENHRPPGHWQHRLVVRLRAHGERVLYPGLPDPDAPRLEEWIAALDDRLAEMGEGERIVVCHSLSCLLWLHRAARGPLAPPVDRLLLVAPPASAALPETAASFRLVELDAAGVRASVRRPIRIAAGDDDPYNPAGAGELYARPLGAELDVVAGGGHLAEDDGYGPWPACEAWCLDPGVALGAAAI